MNEKLTEILINGIDIGTTYTDDDALISYKVYDNIDEYGIQEKYAEIIVAYDKYISLIGNLKSGLSCTIKQGLTTRTDNFLLNGNITNIQVNKPFITIIARNEFWQLTKKEMTYSYDSNIDDEAGELSAIWENVVSEYGGITSSVISSGTGATEIRKKLPISNEKLSSVVDNIVKILGWVQYYRDSTQTAYLEPEGTTLYSTVLDVGTNVVDVPEWNNDYEAAVNIVKVTGAVRRDWNVQTFDGDASETDFTLTYIPKDTEIYISSTLQVRGITGASESFDYEVDEQNKKIIFQSAPASGTTNITVNYSRDVPQAVIARSQDSIDELGFESQNTYPIDDLRDIEDIKQKANSILSAFAFGFLNTELEVVGISDLYVGMQVHITDTINDKDEFLTVKQITYRYPESTDFIEVGNKRFVITQVLNDFKNRLANLEKNQISLDEFLQHLFSTVRTYTTERRYTKLNIQNVAGDVGIYGHPTFGTYGTVEYGSGYSGGFILGHTTFGILGTNKIGSGATSPVTIKLIQGNNTYKEFLYDDDFEDSTGTATWDTSNEEITFTAGQILQTSQISLGTSHTYYTVSLGEVTGTLTTEISGDNGTSWETVTLTTRTAFSSSDGTGVLLKITESGSSTAKIENTYKDSGAYDEPAIKVKLE